MRRDLILFDDRLSMFLDEIKDETNGRKILWNYRRLLEESYPTIEQQQKILETLKEPSKVYRLSVCRLINLMYYERSGNSTRFMTHDRASLTRIILDEEMEKPRSKLFSPREEGDDELFKPLEPVDIRVKRAARYFSIKPYDPSIKDRIDISRISGQKTMKVVKKYKNYYTADQMRGFCQQLGLSDDGDKEEIAYRLTEFLEQN